MPHLGFDPTPGDVEHANHLAKRHHDIAHELNLIAGLVEGIDLSGWEGKTGDAARGRVIEDLGPALRRTASASQQLAAVTRAWTRRLNGFQDEADALEGKAANASAHHDALQTKQASLPPDAPPSPLLQGQLEEASGATSTVTSQAHELHERYLAAASSTADETEEEHPGTWERTEPIRKMIEGILAPFDIVAADHWLGALEKVAGVPAGWLEDLDESIDAISGFRALGGSAADAIRSVAQLAESTGGELDAWLAYSPLWLRGAARSLSEIKGLSKGLSGLGIIADVGTLISPLDKGVMGWVDRGTALLNGGWLAANVVLDDIPIVGEVTIAVTGVYLAGDFLYHHWEPFHNVCDDVGNAIVTASADTVQAAESAAEDVKQATESAAKDVGHAASSTWHSVSSSVGSWF